jgi:hypothetical protein
MFIILRCPARFLIALAFQFVCVNFSFSTGPASPVPPADGARLDIVPELNIALRFGGYNCLVRVALLCVFYFVCVCFF